MRAAMSDDILRPLPRERKTGGAFGGLRAALRLPSGVDEGVMLAVMAAVDAGRGASRGSKAASPDGGGEDIAVGSCWGTEALGISVIRRGQEDEGDKSFRSLVSNKHFQAGCDEAYVTHSHSRTRGVIGGGGLWRSSRNEGDEWRSLAHWARLRP